VTVVLYALVDLHNRERSTQSQGLAHLLVAWGAPGAGSGALGGRTGGRGPATMPQQAVTRVQLLIACCGVTCHCSGLPLLWAA
jgi:hypothetical protein